MNKRLTRSSFVLFMFLCLTNSIGQVGINENVPEQQLHLGSETGTIRVDGLNGTNNNYNGGENDQTYPLYVDENGDLTLEINANQNSDGGDAFLTTDINGEIIISGGVNDGYEAVEILSIPLTVDRDVIVELKYSISIEVFEDNSLNIIRDAYARNITNFFTIDAATLTTTTRKYGQSSRCYFNRNDIATNPTAAPNAATGYIYNSGTTYVPLTAGTHTFRFYGTACSGTNNRDTYVRFAGGPDAIFLRTY